MPPIGPRTDDPGETIILVAGITFIILLGVIFILTKGFHV